MFRLSKIGQSLPASEFRGDRIQQNGQSLQILNADDKIVASMNLETGYYLADMRAMDVAIENEQPTFDQRRTLGHR